MCIAVICPLDGAKRLGFGVRCLHIAVILHNVRLEKESTEGTETSAVRFQNKTILFAQVWLCSQNKTQFFVFTKSGIYWPHASPSFTSVLY